MLRLPEKELEPVEELVKMPLKVRAPEIEAVLDISTGALKEAPPEKIFKAVQVFEAEREAGPLVQSSLTKVSVEFGKDTLKLLDSNDTDDLLAKLAPVSRNAKAFPSPPLISVPQENKPESQRSLLLLPLQLDKPAPDT